MDEHIRRRAVAPWALRAGLAGGLLGVVLFSLVTAASPDADVPTRTPGIIVGIPGGAVIQAAPSSTSAPLPTPTTRGAAPATPAPTPGATATPAPAPTAAPPSAPPSVGPPPATVPSTPVPTAAVVAVVGAPEAAVATFYRHVVAGEFDAAYAVWSERMKSTYPRDGNLDERFDQTADITFSELFTAERTDTTAVVQANFTETYDSGGSRNFIGYWRLVLVDGRWLLDAPHY